MAWRWRSSGSLWGEIMGMEFGVAGSRVSVQTWDGWKRLLLLFLLLLLLGGGGQ